MKKLALALLMLASVPAHAHHFMDGGMPQNWLEGLLSGLGHPVIGPDHAAFVFAAGFLLAISRRGLWGIAALVLGALVGAALHLAGMAFPALEAAIASSVIIVGVLVMARRDVKLSALAAVLAIAGALHGYAYAETIFGAEAGVTGAYLLGFSLMQFAVAAAGFFLHRRLIASGAPRTASLSASLGAAAATIGMAFLVIDMAL
jgi:urease accessory protein